MTKPKPHPVTVAECIAGLAGRPPKPRVIKAHDPRINEWLALITQQFADAAAHKAKARRDSIAAGKKRRRMGPCKGKT